MTHRATGALFLLVAGCGPVPSSSAETGAPSCPASLPATPLDRGCPDGGLPSDLDTALTLTDLDGNPCPGLVCAGDAVTVAVDAVNHCTVDVSVDVSCTVPTWSLAGPDGFATASTEVCGTVAISSWSVAPGTSVQVEGFSVSHLPPGTYTLDVQPYGGPAAASVTFCLER